MAKKTILITSILIAPCWHALHAASGDLDNTFGASGLRATLVSRADNLAALAINPSNNIIITGTTQTTAPTLFLAQYTAGGSLDTANFNSGGSMPGTQTLLLGSNSQAHAIALDSSNRILVAGYVTQSQSNILLARYNTNGTLDTTFNSPTGYIIYSIGAGSNANGVGVQSTGRIIVGGSSVTDGIPSITLLGFTSSGTLDTTFGSSGIVLSNPGVINILTALAIQSDDKIVALGTADGVLTIIRYNANGSIDTGFGTSGIFQPNISSSMKAYDITLDSSGRIIIAASIIESNVLKSVVIRVTSGGALDTSFNTTGYVIQSILYGSEYYAVVAQSDNKIIASGYAIGGLSNELTIARYLTTGALDTAYGTNGITLTDFSADTAVYDVKLQSSGNAITGGLTNGTFFVQRYLAA